MLLLDPMGDGVSTGSPCIANIFRDPLAMPDDRESKIILGLYG